MHWWAWYWREYVAAYSYVRDPHAWWQRWKDARRLKTTPRPAIYQMNGAFVVHPALYESIRHKVPDLRVGGFLLGAPEIIVSEFSVENPPAGGWWDVLVPERPRLAP